MVLGHSNCGAVQAALSNDPLTPLFEQLVNPIRASLTPGETLENSIKVNASATSRQLTSRSDVLANAVKDGTLQIVVGYFDIGSGKVSLIWVLSKYHPAIMRPKLLSLTWQTQFISLNVPYILCKLSTSLLDSLTTTREQGYVDFIPVSMSACRPALTARQHGRGIYESLS